MGNYCFTIDFSSGGGGLVGGGGGLVVGDGSVCGDHLPLGVKLSLCLQV